MSYLIGPQNLTNETTSCFDDVCCEPWSVSAIGRLLQLHDPYINPFGL